MAEPDSRPLTNITCPYCAAPIDKKTRTKEHVIGRRFVPKGTFDRQWNLILWACGTCNTRKSDLENDLAALTLNFHTAGLSSMSDVLAQGEAVRRGGKSISRKTGKPVSESGASVSFHGKLGSIATLSVNFTGPPQIDDTRAYELARLQMMGFFYFLTFEKDKQIGHFWIGDFFPVHGTIRSDWGNPLHIAFAKQIEHWDYRLILNTAQNYYRAVIRRHPTKDCWAWAVEWNAAYRLVGYFGERDTAQSLFDELPPLPAESVIEARDGSHFRIRAEQSISDSQDTLFSICSADA